MRAAPALQVSLRRFGLWQGGVLVLAGLAIATLTAWLVTHERPVETFVWAATGLWMIAVVALAASALRVPAADLRWDGRAWYLGSGAGDPLAGDLSVAIDLGRWMLLRFTPAVPPDASVRWLPVQRLGIESQWHALRCSVYAPRPMPGDDSTGAP